MRFWLMVLGTSWESGSMWSLSSIQEESFTKAMFWDQIHNIPMKYIEESIERKVGQKIGEVIKMDFPVMEGCI